MRSDDLPRSFILLAAAVLTMAFPIGCQPRPDTATDRATMRTPPSPPTVDHHPPRRTPEN